jgi:hypothetical protein
VYFVRKHDPQRGLVVLRGVDLVAHEFKDAQPGDPDAGLNLALPLGGR